MTQPDIEFRGPEQDPDEIIDLESVLFAELIRKEMGDVCYVKLTGINFVADRPASDIDPSLLATVMTEEGTETDVDIPFTFCGDQPGVYRLLPADRERSADYDGYHIEHSTVQALLKLYKGFIGEVAVKN